MSRGTVNSKGQVWDPILLTWVAETQPGGSGGGGGAATIADGADVAQGTTGDAAWTSGAGTVIGLLKKIASAGGSAVSVADGSDVAEGTTTDAAVVSDANGTLSAKLRGLVKIFASVWDSGNGRLKVDGSAATQPVSAASLPLPTGASTAALQQSPLTTSGSIASTGTPLVLALTRPSPSTTVVFLDNGQGAGAGTFVIEGSADGGTTWSILWAFPVDGSASNTPKFTQSISLNTSPGAYVVNTSGYTHVRARATAIAVGPFSTFILAYPQSVGIPATVLVGGDHTTAAKVNADGSFTAALTTGTQPIAYGGGGEAGGNTLRVSIADANAPIGAVLEVAPASDTASSGLNGRLQRIAQRLTSLIALLPAALGAGGGLKVDGSGTALPVTANAGTNLNTSALALDATLTGGTQQTKITDGTNIATVKAASTLPTATDKAVVVTLRESLSTPVTGPLTDTQLRAVPVPVSGTVTTTPPANASTNVAQFGGTNASTGTGASGAGIPRVTVANDSNVLVTPPTLTKGTQAATGFSTQDLKDSGRVNIAWTALVAPAATAETLATITESRDGAATTTFTTKVITSGKRLRITSVSMQVENSLGTSIQRAYLRMRVNTAGAVTTSSPQQGLWAAQALGTVKSISAPLLEEFPDGFEILGDGTKQIGFSIQAPDWVTASATLNVYLTFFGYEY